MKSTKNVLLFEPLWLRNEIMTAVLGRSLANCFRVFTFLSEMLHCVSANELSRSFALAPFLRGPNTTNSFSRSDISFGSYGNSCYAGVRLRLTGQQGSEGRKCSKQR